MGLLLACLSRCGKLSITRALTRSSKKTPVKRHVTLMGCSGVGKSCLLLSLCGEEFRSDHQITLIDNVKRDVEVDDQKVDLEIWDTPGRESLDRLRTLSYPETDVVLLCFSLDSSSSLDSVKEDWYPIVHHFLPGVPTVLVGTKADLRKCPKAAENLVTPETAEEVMKTTEASFYRETSAMTGENVRELFYEAIKITLGEGYKPRTFAQWIKGTKGDEGSYVRF